MDLLIRPTEQGQAPRCEGIGACPIGGVELIDLTSSSSLSRSIGSRAYDALVWVGAHLP